MLRIPGEMNEYLGFNLRDGRWFGEQVDLMPNNTGKLFARAPAHGMHLVSRRQERRECVPTYESRGTREQDSAHGCRSRYAASRAEMIRSAAGVGHSIPNAGSFQRTPRAASGT